jgi:hypothetical protein
VIILPRQARDEHRENSKRLLHHFLAEYPLCEHTLSPGVAFIPLLEGALEAMQEIDALIPP